MSAPAEPPDLAWLDRFPALAALRDRANLDALGVCWSTEGDAREGGEAIEAHYADSWHLGVLWTDALWAMCRDDAKGLWRVASCPEVAGGTGAMHAGALYLRPERPDELIFAPGDEVPAALWLRVPAEAGAVRALLGEFYPPRRLARAELTHGRRAFVGYIETLGVPNPYSGELEAATPHALDRHWTFSPHLDVKAWGSAYADDPWNEGPAPLGPAYAALNRQARAQREGAAVGSFTHRTLFSRAHVSFEVHQLRFYVVDVRYRPSPHGGVIARLNERLGTAFPTDLPFDVVGALLGFQWVEAGDVERRLAEQTDAVQVSAYLQVAAALRHADLRVTGLLRQRLGHDDVRVRGAVANLAVDYNWEFLLEDLALRERDPSLAAFVKSVLDDGIGPPKFDEHGEPVGLDAGNGDDDEALDDGDDEALDDGEGGEDEVGPSAGERDGGAR